MDAVADLADRYSFGEIRVTHEQNLTFPHVHKIYTGCGERFPLGLATPNIGQLTDIIACPGSTTAASPTLAPSRSRR